MANAAKKKVSIVDYGMGNLFSVMRACEQAGLDAAITSVAKEIERADAVILPGVGSFGDAMEAIRKLDLGSVIKETADSSKPLFGVCLGMQLMMGMGYEFGEHEGLGIFPGKVVRFEHPRGEHGEIKVPQVCWNQIYPTTNNTSWERSPLEGLPLGTHMYFVHSYYVIPEEKNVSLSTTAYGSINFCSSLMRENIFACQYHPERSGELGLEVYKNFARLIGIGNE